jgi:ISXO2-like transposase domain
VPKAQSYTSRLDGLHRTSTRLTTGSGRRATPTVASSIPPASARVYVDGDVHTQSIDGFFGLFKTSVRGAHHAVSHKWLQGYLNESTWRWNRRESDVPMFRDLLDEAVKPAV